MKTLFPALSFLLLRDGLVWTKPTVRFRHACSIGLVLRFEHGGTAYRYL